MKKKNLIILLIFPFLISVFCIITVNTTYNMIDVDISHIDWDYNDMEGFQLSEGQMYALKAEGVNQRHYAVSGGNDLVWSVENKDLNDPEPCAEIVKEGDTYFIRPLKSGEVIITCSNAKGNVQRRLTAVIYVDAAILLYPTISTSQSNIDSVIYYGEYDHTLGEMAKIDMTLVTLPSVLKNEVEITTSENLKYEDGVVSILSPGEAFVKVSDPKGRSADATYEFYVVDEGINVYTYEDLLYCTNYSEDGHIAVLRKHFESLENTYVMNGESFMLSDGALVKKPGVNNVECFGNYNPQTKEFSFAEEIYSFETTYNKNFIEQWNEFVKTNRQYSPISSTVYAGLRVQKDFYGNGYTINLHNLTYPYSYTLMMGESGEVRIPTLTSKNLFRGPLKMYSLGDPNNTPLVSLYGQDNVGVYVDGDGICLNDISIKNCDFGDRMANLDTVGTVVEIYGNGVTIKNSRLSNGKNVLRSFSSMDLLLENSLLSNARNFLFVTGANEYEPVDLTREVSFPGIAGNTVTMTVGDYLMKGAEGDVLVNSFLQNYFDSYESKRAMKTALLAIQDALGTVKDISTQYKGTTVIRDTYFYRSGIASICMESLFSSPFLETGSSPSLITDIFATIQEGGKTLIPYTPTGASGVAYPVTLTVEEGVRFYDYKEVGKIDLEGLIEENISAIANSLNLYDGTITIDDIFPLQTMIRQQATAVSAIYNKDSKSYYNIPIVYYGGGLNLSKVTMGAEKCTEKVEVDILDNYLSLKGTSGAGAFANMRGLMLKTVASVTGFEPFGFHFVKNGHLFGETPNVSELVANARE
ncbi:MAG: hypothetical protein J6Q85_05375 [Clostridia bacterium]|nr:hypothetical protein [Clostridia bacterium]